MVKVSIMMPVYNLDKYIERSVNSILNQTLKDIELICVNDGSTDNSLEILRDLEKKYDFIKVFSQENQGAGPALNRCIDESSGEYIAFLDADDVFLDEDALEKLYEIGHDYNADMVAGNLLRTNLKGEIMNNPNYKNGNYAYFSKNDVITPDKYGIPWAFYKNIFKRSFLNDNNIRFPPYKRGVDPLFLARVLVNVDEIYTSPVYLYGYNYSVGGGFNNKLTDYDFKKNHLIVFKDVFDVLESGGLDETAHKFKFELMSYLKYYGNDTDFEIYKLVREIYGEDGAYFKDYIEEYELFNVNQLLNHLEEENTEEFFQYVKSEFFKMKLSNNFLISKYLLRKAYLVLTSNSLDEYKDYIYDLEVKQLEKKNKKLKKEHDSLKKKNDKLKKDIKKAQKKNKELLSSNSWKLTKPLRGIKKIFK